MSKDAPASLDEPIPAGRRKPKQVRVAEHSPSPEADERRQRIRQTGAMLLVQRGVSGFGMESLARRTRVAPSAMPHLYKRREALLADLVSRHVHELNKVVCAAYDATGSAAPRERVEAMLRAFLDAALADRPAHILSMHAQCSLFEREREAVRLRWRSLFETLAEPLLALAPAGSSPAAGSVEKDKRRAAMLAMAVAASVGNMLLWFDDAAALDRGEHVRRLTTMLVAGVQGDRAGTCDRLDMSCARAWLLLGDR